jgi:hypothetical protein
LFSFGIFETQKAATFATGGCEGLKQLGVGSP